MRRMLCANGADLLVKAQRMRVPIMKLMMVLYEREIILSSNWRMSCIVVEKLNEMMDRKF